MATTTTGSENIALLDSRIIADTCSGDFLIDISPSVFIASGALNVLGANVRVTNPLGVIIKDFSLSGYDIEGGSPPMQDVVEVGIPTEAGNYQYGAYTVLVTLYDADGTQYSITKTIPLSVPNPKNKTKKFGVATATIKGLCKDGKAVIQVTTPQNYRGQIVESLDQEFTLEYPTSSEIDPLVTSLSAFSVPLFEGVYKITGEICATYNLGDNVYVSILYKLKYEKKVACIIDECCVFAQLASLHTELSEDCTEDEKLATASKVLDALRLLKTAQLAGECNEDASDYINDLEALLGCSCSCNCNDGVPIINNAPAKDFLITGCNVTKTTVGLTDNYNIENYEYTVEVEPNGNALYVSSTTLANCTKKTSLIFNIAVVYSQIKNQANSNITEAEFWSSVMNNVLVGMTDAPTNWDTLTVKEKVQHLLTSIKDVVDDAEDNEVSITAQNGVSLFGYTSANPNEFIIELGGNPLTKDTTIAGAFLFRLSQGNWQVDTLTGLGGASEAGYQLKVIGNVKFTGKMVNPQQTLTYGATTTWNLNSGEEATVTLTGNTILNITNLAEVCYGVLVVKQDAIGSRTVTLPAGSKVSPGGAGVISLTATANAIDVICFRYDGTTFFWRKALNYT